MDGDKFYLTVAKKLVRELDGDLALALWYSALLSYSKRFKKDQMGYFRVSSKLIAEDLGLTRSQVRTLNGKLVDRGIIKTDSASRGGRSFAGYKML